MIGAVSDAPRTQGRSSGGSLAAWLIAIRRATLPAACSGVVVGLGAARADGAPFRPDTAVVCLAVALLLQILANLANDLSDFRRGADTAERIGPTRAALAGLLSPHQLEAGIGLTIAAAGLAGSYLVGVGGPAVLALGAAAVIAALAYTGGPWPYGYRGLGEPLVFIFFGLVAVAGTAYLQAGRLDPLDIVAAVPVGALVTAILVVNNQRDITTDRAAGKRTLAVQFGEGFAKAEYGTCLLLAAAVPLGLLAVAAVVAYGIQVGPLVLLPLASCPLALPLWRQVRTGGDPRRLNAVLRGTARLSFIFSLLFAVGLAAPR